MEDVKSERGLRVLVVDDDPVLGGMFLDILEMAGHYSEVTKTGPEALALLRRKSFDLIISDLRMPLMSGQELWEKLAPEHPELAARMIFVSAEQPEAASCQFMKDTGHTFLRKPFDIRELLTLVNRSAPCGSQRQTICA